MGFSATRETLAVDLPRPAPLGPRGYQPEIALRQGGPLAPLHRYREVLVVMLDHIGDWVLCTPFLRRLREHTSARITVVVSEPVAPLARRCPFVDHVAGRGVAFGCSFDLALVPRWDVD